MGDQLKFILRRIGERLWVKPLLVCMLSIAGALLAKLVDDSWLNLHVPDITAKSINELLKIISASMLVIATFAVASMVSAYASVSSTATPRAFPLIIADDVSQNALSTFIGAFIFSIVALIATENGYYDKAGRFAIFLLTLFVFALVIVTFVRWVDRIARLGRMGNTVAKVEQATTESFEQLRCAPTLGGVAVGPRASGGRSVYGASIGYVQRIDVEALQSCAKKSKLRITVSARPGTFAAPGREIAYVSADDADIAEIDLAPVAKAFLIDSDRKFDEDPRFGLIVLSEIASRALSPAVNDPGTAIDIVGSMVRLFSLLAEPVEDKDRKEVKCDRVHVPEVSLRDMFDDAFSAIARDGAANIEVLVRLQKALEALAFCGNATMRTIAIQYARLALSRGERGLNFPQDVALLREVSKFTEGQFAETR